MVQPKDKPLTKRQLEVLEAIHYGEVYIVEDWKQHTKPHAVSYWCKPKFNGVDVSSVIARLKARKLLRIRRDETCKQRRMRGQGLYSYYVLLPVGELELERHPAPWKE